MAGKFSLEAIFKATDKLSAPLAKIQSKLSGFGRGATKAMSGVNKAVDKSMAGIGKMSGALGIAGVASIAGIGFQLSDTIEKGREFEQTLIRAGAALPVPAKRGTAAFAKLAEAAKNVGATTEISALQAAAGLESLITAGYDAEQAIGALPKVVDFATAGQLELAQASEIASNALGAFGLKAKDPIQTAANMGRVMDVMIRAGADSQTTITELAAAFEEGASTASKAGASVEEFSGLLGILAASGTKGSKAGTALRNVFTRLNKQTPVAAEVMKKYGLRVARAKDGTIDMATTVGNFNKKLGKLTLNQQQAAIATIFGDEAMGGFLSLMGAGPDKIAAFVGGLKDASGTTKEMATTFREGTDAKIKQFFNTIDNVKLDVFSAIAPALLDIANATQGWVTANKDLISTKATEWITELRDNLPKIWGWAVLVGKGFAVFAGVAVTVKAVNVAILAFEAATKLAAAGTWLWNVALKAGTAAANSTVLATVGLKVAQLASWSATVLSTAAQAAYSTQLNLSTLASLRLKAAEVASRIAQLASRAATLLATAAQGAYTAVLAVTSGGLAAFTAAAAASVPAIGAQAAALAPLLITVGAATAAVMGLVAAWNQYNKLDKELAGSGGVSGTVSKMWEMGTFDPFAAHDAVMNEKAREERKAREQPQIVSPQARAAFEVAEASATASVDGTITVEAMPGTKASARARPNSVPLVVQPSGAF